MSGRLLEKHYPTSEVAYLLGKNVKTVREWMKAGEFGPLDEQEARALGLSPILADGNGFLFPLSRINYWQSLRQYGG